MDKMEPGGLDDNSFRNKKFVAANCNYDHFNSLIVFETYEKAPTVFTVFYHSALFSTNENQHDESIKTNGF